MKRFIFTLAIMSLSIGLFAGYQKTPDDTLQEIIAPNIPLLNAETISRGEPIYAGSTTVNYLYKNTLSKSIHPLCHTGYYLTSCINTFFDKNYGPEFFGRQQIFGGSIAGSLGLGGLIHSNGQEELESKIWRVEVINDTKYVVHFYEDFCVYTSADTQFVLAN